MPSRTAPDVQHRRPKRPFWTVAFVLGVLVSAAAADAQELWGEVRLPGGAPHARRAFSLGLPDDRPDSAWLFDYLSREFSESKVLGAVAFERYVAILEAAQAQHAEWPEGVALPPANASAHERTRGETALKTFGLALRRRGDLFQAELDQSEAGAERIAALQAAGVDVAELALALNAGRAARLVLSDSRLPLPLATYWTQHVFTRNVSPIVAIVGSRVHSLVYLGLLALDDETLSFLQPRSALVRQLGTDAGSAFAAFGRSLRVRNNAIEVPGGRAAAAVWRELVGRQPEDAERFILNLLTRDGGRLAYFYDTVAHLSPAKQHFVLGGGLQGADQVRFVRRIAAHFASSHPDWKIENRPFNRPAFDPAVALMFVDVQQDGSIGPRWLPPLLARVTDNEAWPTDPERTFSSLRDGSPDALWMMDWLFERPQDTQTRFALLRFAQRRFTNVPRELAPRVGMALLSARDMPALPRALERMSVTDPVVYADVAVAAYNLTLSGSADDVAPVVARWQAALGLLEQAHRRRPLPASALRALLESLVKSTPGQRRGAPGAIAAWVVEHALPALVPDGPIEELEMRAVRAFTAASGREPVRLSWEGLQYVVDIENTAFRSALALRQTDQGQGTLADLARLHAARRRIEQMKTLDDPGRVVSELKGLESTLGRVAAAGDAGARIVRDLRSTTGQLDRIRNVSDLTRVDRALALLLDAIDVASDTAVPPLIYALAIAPSREPPAIYQDAWRAHSLRHPVGFALGSWTDVAWQVPEVDVRTGGGLMLRGAMLGLDVILAETRLIRAASDGPTRSSSLLNRERDTLLRYLAYGHTLEWAQEPLAAFDVARRRIAGWATEIPAPGVLTDQLRRSGVNEWRANVLAWEAHRSERGIASWLTPLEILRLESMTPLATSWHGPAPLFDGCHCLRGLDPSSPDGFRDRESGVLIALIPNLPLRLGEHLRALELPVWLVPVLLPVAIQDWIDNAGQVSSGDWEASAGWLRRLSRERVEEYLLALIAARVLVPPPAVGSLQ